MLPMVSEPSLTDPPVRTQDPSGVLLHALHGIRSMSPGQFCTVQTCSSARTGEIVARNAAAVRNPNLDMFASPPRRSHPVLAPFRPSGKPGFRLMRDPKCVSYGIADQVSAGPVVARLPCRPARRPL